MAHKKSIKKWAKINPPKLRKLYHFHSPCRREKKVDDQSVSIMLLLHNYKNSSKRRIVNGRVSIIKARTAKTAESRRDFLFFFFGPTSSFMIYVPPSNANTILNIVYTINSQQQQRQQKNKISRWGFHDEHSRRNWQKKNNKPGEKDNNSQLKKRE